MRRASTALKLALGAAGTGTAASAWWWRTHPSACPYAQRFWVQAPHPFITRRRLRELLDPQPGEQILEVGPGTGYYSLSVARWLLPDGTLHLLDLQQEMLDHVMRRAARQSLSNLAPTRGDARALPYPDGFFDAACMAVALGEIPDPGRAISELARVLRPSGRLVVGEIYADPHVVRFADLRRYARQAGLGLERKVGRVGYFARFEK